MEHRRIRFQIHKERRLCADSLVSKDDYDSKDRWVRNNQEPGARLESINSKYEQEPAPAEE